MRKKQSETAKRSNEPNVSLEKFILLADLTFTNLSKTCFLVINTSSQRNFSEYSQQNCICGEALVDNETADQLTKSN
ncbi:unnamed protein product [Rhizophagus irregularis]|nr:unnamed protein product [Rhizophagus irregularis]